jgi:hypothetical protein
VIDTSLLGLELGQFKDELKGQIISEGLFLAPKQYGYYINENGIRKEFSVFSGVPRNSLTFQEVMDIFNGKIISKNISNRFFKSFNTLNIDIKNTKITIKNNKHKILVNNEYLSPIINQGHNNLFIILFNKFKNLIIKNIKKYLK